MKEVLIVGKDRKKLETARDEYLLNCRIQGKSEKTTEQYSSVIMLCLRRLEDGEFSPASVKSFISDLLDTRKPTTASSYCRAAPLLPFLGQAGLFR